MRDLIDLIENDRDLIQYGRDLIENERRLIENERGWIENERNLTENGKLTCPKKGLLTFPGLLTILAALQRGISQNLVQTIKTKLYATISKSNAKQSD